jgi:hypothetical protein
MLDSFFFSSSPRPPHNLLSSPHRLMNEELSSMPGFAPPESYFRIGRREDGTSGKFFSHIEKIPWDDM